MNSIIYDEEIRTPEKYIYQYYNNFIKKLDKKDCVKLSLFCAKIVNQNTKKYILCIELVEKWLVDKKSISIKELHDAAYDASYIVSNAAHAITYAANATDIVTYVVVYCIDTANINIINKYLQVLLRNTKQFQNNKILEQISKTDIDKLELVDWNMITDIMQEEYNIVHEFDYEDIFSRRCLIELLRREYL